MERLGEIIMASNPSSTQTKGQPIIFSIGGYVALY